MGKADERTRTIMEVDSIAVEVATESIQVALDTIEATTETMHPSTLFTIVEIGEGTENL
jgi:CRISPR/Cas system CMR-associated protein Cmr5 small subunit